MAELLKAPNLGQMCELRRDFSALAGRLQVRHHGQCGHSYHTAPYFSFNFFPFTSFSKSLVYYFDLCQRTIVIFTETLPPACCILLILHYHLSCHYSLLSICPIHYLHLPKHLLLIPDLALADFTPLLAVQSVLSLHSLNALNELNRRPRSSPRSRNVRSVGSVRSGLQAPSSSRNISNLPLLRKKVTMMSLQQASSHLVAGFSAEPLTLLLNQNGQNPYMFGPRTKALRSLMSRLKQDIITVFNAVTRIKMSFILLLLLIMEFPASPSTGKENTASI